MVLSSLTCPLEARGDQLGSEVTLSLPRVGSPLTLRYRCGNAQGVIVRETTRETCAWVPPVELAAEYPELQRIPVELTLELLRGGRVAESRSKWLLLGLPQAVLPQGSMTVTDETGAKELCGSFLRGYSRAAVQVEARGSAGAEIRDCRITCGALTGQGTKVCFDLPKIGTQTVTARVTDSRGRCLELTTTVRVAARLSPQGAVLSAEPCDEGGTVGTDGDWLLVHAIGSVTSFPNLIPSFTLRGKDGDGTAKAWDLGAEGRLDKRLVIPKVTGLELEISDGLESLVFPYKPQPLLDMDIPGKALGIGCRGDRTGTVSLGLPVEMRGNRLTGLGGAAEAGDALPLGQAEGRYLGPQLLWENPEPEAAFSPTEIPAEGGLFLIEGAEKTGGNHFWEVVGDKGCLRVVSAGKTAARPVEKKTGALAFGSADLGDDWAVPLRIIRLLPGKEKV